MLLREYTLHNDTQTFTSLIISHLMTDCKRKMKETKSDRDKQREYKVVNKHR